MKYRLLAKTYARIEATASRLEMTSLLAELFRATPPEIIARAVYLTQGKLHPDFEGIEIGMAKKIEATLTVDEVHRELDRAAHATGKGLRARGSRSSLRC